MGVTTPIPVMTTRRSDMDGFWWIVAEDINAQKTPVSTHGKEKLAMLLAVAPAWHRA
jgi:hypothetical protein